MKIIDSKLPQDVYIATAVLRAHPTSFAQQHFNKRIPQQHMRTEKTELVVKLNVYFLGSHTVLIYKPTRISNLLTVKYSVNNSPSITNVHSDCDYSSLYPS